MSEPGNAPAPPKRMLGPMLLWSAAIVAALALTWFIGAVAVPHYKTWTILKEGANTWSWDYPGAIERLGGPERAAAKLRAYLRLPKFFAPHRWVALVLLWMSDRSSIPELIRALGDTDESTREVAARILGSIGPDARIAVPALERALQDENPGVRSAAAEALKQIRGEEKK